MRILWSDMLQPNQIALNSNLYEDLSRPQGIPVNIGLFRVILDVVIKDDVPEDTIELSKNLSKVYTIPTDILYDCLIKDREIHIGPVIAYIESGFFKFIKDSRYFFLIPKFMDYYKIKGIVFMCTEDSINIEDEIIEGYYFNPKDKAIENGWKRGKFPLPNAVFNRSFISQKKISLLQEKIGDTIFNSYWYNLDKWGIWKTLSKDEVLKKHLPYTEKYSGVLQVEKLLTQYDSLYLKPRTKSRGVGILMVIREEEGVLVINNTMERWYFEDYKSLSKFLRNRIRIPYIVQQAVPFEINNQHLGFRVFLQKDDSKDWMYCGLLARIAPLGGIITNGRGQPEKMLGKEALITEYKLNSQTAEKVEKEMTDLVIRAIKKYEEKGVHLGDVAADIIMDGSLHIWILELQLNQGISGNNTVLQSDFYKTILTNPFKYAKSLTVFHDKEL